MTNDTVPTEPTDPRWAEGAIVYHIYPRSLQDSNADGVGDLPGITRRLGYVRSLGSNAIWLSPFYPSPMADFGYDIADYTAVDPQFGTLDDFKALLDRAHRLDMRVIIDLVPNHTSDDHEWFQQSRASRDNPYSDWYIWSDGRSGSDANDPVPPNNWRDVLTGGPAWQWDETRQQFYLHSFNVRQPDLNWNNADVRAALKDVMRFWLDLGVDGFRVDAVYWMGKHPLLQDDTENPDYQDGISKPYDALLHDNSRGWPTVYAHLAEMADVLKEPAYLARECFMVTEAYPERHNPVEAYMDFYVSVDPAVAAPFNFEGVSLPWKAASWRDFLTSFHAALDQFSPLCIPSNAFGNHDQPRLASRLGEPAARSAALLLLTLPGMAFVYYGEEIGMHDVSIPADTVRDPAAGGDPLHGIGRDPERTPMQWDDSRQAGFSDGDSTWLPVADDFATRNVAAQEHDPTSFLTLYRTLGRLRNNSVSLRSAHFKMLDVGNPEIVAYVRQAAADRAYLVLINFSDTEAAYQLPDHPEELLCSTLPPRGDETTSGATVLRAHEAVLYAYPLPPASAE